MDIQFTLVLNILINILLLYLAESKLTFFLSFKEVLYLRNVSAVSRIPPGVCNEYKSKN